MNENLQIAIIQTSLDNDAAWVDSVSNWKDAIQISDMEERRAKKEIRQFLSNFKGPSEKPSIVLLPELSVPRSLERYLKKCADSFEVIIIAGLDYMTVSESPATVSNEAIIIVPRRLNGKKIGRRTSVRRIGKTYPAAAEEANLNSISHQSVSFRGNSTIWLFESEDLGNFAVAICYDFLDLDRIVMYRGKIQTLFILAYNRDTTSFDHAAEAISRMVFCNVVVCNCGKFGGSLAVSPFYKPYKRTIYRNSGMGLANSQTIELPLEKIIAHQNQNSDGTFKSLPPGYVNTATLTISETEI